MKANPKYANQLNKMGTLNIKPESILVYVPAKPMTEQEYNQTYSNLTRTACRALGCDPHHLPVGIIILRPGDKLEMLPSKVLLKEIEERLARIEEKVGK